MVMNEKELQIETLTVALSEIDSIIENMRSKDYPNSEINEFVKKRWNILGELYKVKKQ